jgi:hypothetical protein
MVRDPRKAKQKREAAAASLTPVPPPDNKYPTQYQPPIVPQPQQPESLGQSLVHYAVAGVGVSLGFILVRLVLGF